MTPSSPQTKWTLSTCLLSTLYCGAMHWCIIEVFLLRYMLAVCLLHAPCLFTAFLRLVCGKLSNKLDFLHKIFLKIYFAFVISIHLYMPNKFADHLFF